MRTFLLIFSAIALAAAEPTWTPAVDCRFDGSVALVAIPAESRNATGSLPTGTKEDSAWADLKIAYEAGTGFVRATMSEWKKGEAQLKYRLQRLEPGTWRIAVNAGSISKNKLTFSISDNGPPYKAHVQKTIELKPEAGELLAEFEIGALDGPKALLVRLGKAGTVELRAIRLERRN